MFRNFARVTRTTRPISLTARSSLLGPTRTIVSYTSRTAVRAKYFQKCRSTLLTRYSSTASGDNPASESSSEAPEAPQDVPWLELLESAAKAPWLTSIPPDHQDRLKRSYSLLFYVILYLGRPLSKDPTQAEEATQQFLLVNSEVGRARYAIGLLTKTITKDITSIPDTSPLRTQHAQIFALTDALLPLCEVHLDGVAQGTPPTSGEIVDEGKWQEFWSKAQPVVLALGEELDKEGYGISEELVKEAQAEQERKEREAATAGGDN
ncbi:hypothetical protein AN958_04399 [Leucoagaricus sp. SymC.cos]|nr:hypothetical protein AN958_04399 [Leucoagaricus sp. SymC.cos]